ncbi:DUF6220 domain-containing protein [Asanoa sp. WMMD1127]|uniref:DUF6220 domain-containing protein n=1 Tax=Asanoa sp. WMMD1127 TaxID=3016107 RepID=UPI00241652B7|nr:DUF6220 domain-containing protein [Asanoa sp. WMMD1127]MDG4825604.1 DUF6220 domain-containing protein [Asanoa sp. WMMD1127]
MRKAFVGLSALLVLVVVAQFYFAATGAFGSDFAAHLALGWAVFFLPVVLVLVAAAGRLPGRLIGLPALVAGLAALQVGIAAVADALGDDSTAGVLVFGLHAVNGLAILGVSVAILRATLERALE